jgi:carbonic anhydrase
MSVRDEVLAANAEYAASFGDRGDLVPAPARRFAILTCMDARLDPARFAGLSEGDAHVIRNAGGRASDDAIRSLVISSELLGTREWFVIHHTDCGMELLTEQALGGEKEELPHVDWLTLGKSPHDIVDDVARIRAHPLVPKSIPIYGFVFDVQTGTLNEVAEATRAGAAA